MPDIDMDFADDRRDEVIQYVIDRYGSDRVAQIITFGRLQARAAIRDVGRALDLPLNEVDRVAKLIPPIPIGLKIADALEQSPELKSLYDGQPHIQRLIDTARSVEGVARNAGTHAAGVVVADQPLTELRPAAARDARRQRDDPVRHEGPGQDRPAQDGFPGAGQPDDAVQGPRQRQGRVRGIELDLGKLPLDDPQTYAMLSRGETRTVFQLEGAGMTRSVQELRPSTLDHLAALVALYRPGPMAHIPSYIARRDGREPSVPPDPALADVLEESYGIIVYQDQVLQVVRKLAGYSLGQADVLRRAMGKKDKEVMAQEGPKFTQAVVEHGYSSQHRRARLGAAPAVRWLRVRQGPRVLLCAGRVSDGVLQGELPGGVVRGGVEHDRRRTPRKSSAWSASADGWGSTLLPPDVNASALDVPVEDGGIRFGLAAVKNVGEGAVEQIVREREANGPYISLEEFCRRQDLHTINKRVIESLAKCGAMDGLGQREALLDSKRLDSAIAAAQIDQKAASTGQVSLFDLFGGVEALAPKPVAGCRADWTMRRVARAVQGARALGKGSAGLPVRRPPVHGGGRLARERAQPRYEPAHRPS